jgi:porin
MQTAMRLFLPVIPLVGFLASAQESPPSESLASRMEAGRKPTAGEMVAGNPAAVNQLAGTGQLGQWVGIPRDTGVRLGGVWLGDGNYLISGGVEPRQTTWNSLLILDFSVDFAKAFGWKGSSFGTQFLQYNGQETNAQAGTVQGYNSLVGVDPLERTELYQLWWRQSFLDDQVVLRIGKLVPTIDFTNLQRPIDVLPGMNLPIPAITGLLYTPAYVNPSTLGVMPGYYNSAYGVVIDWNPIQQFSLTYGVYDGALAQGVQTGNRIGPVLDGAYFHIVEAGGWWAVGEDALLGRAGLGGWCQTGELTGGGNAEDGTTGMYLYASQTVWRNTLPPGYPPQAEGMKAIEESHPPSHVDQGILVFLQGGINQSDTLIIDRFAGGGASAFGLVPGRPNDSFGVGVATSWLNTNIFARSHETIVQGYYQASLFSNLSVQPTLTYIASPGASASASDAWAASLRVTVLF